MGRHGIKTLEGPAIHGLHHKDGANTPRPNKWLHILSILFPLPGDLYHLYILYTLYLSVGVFIHLQATQNVW